VSREQCLRQQISKSFIFVLGKERRKVQEKGGDEDVLIVQDPL